MTRKGQRQSDKARKARMKRSRRNKVERDQLVSAMYGDGAHRSCGRKARYETREQAENKAVELGLRGAPPLRAYACRYCGGWHLTKQPLMADVTGGGKDGRMKEVVNDVTRKAAAINARLGMGINEIAESLHIGTDVVEESIEAYAEMSDDELGIVEPARPSFHGTYYLVMSDAGTPVALFSKKAKAQRVARAMSSAMEKVGGPCMHVTPIEAWDEA